MDGTQHDRAGQAESILEHALGYLARGWSIIPIRAGTKKPACREWGGFQSERPGQAKLRRWFAKRSDIGIAVVLGAVSGGLVCRDFDTMESYKRWAADHPGLAAELPTVATARGRHVYFLSDHRGIVHFDDGELRGGGYCLLPPSRHPDGPTYEWLIPPPDGPLPYVKDIQAAGFLCRGARNVTERTETPERTERTEDHGAYRGSPKTADAIVQACGSPDDFHVDLNTQNVVIKNLPAAIGQRNRQVFELARALKGMPQWTDAHGDACEPAVRLWHRLGIERGVIGTEPFEETWIDFLKAWPKIKFPKGDEPMQMVLEQAKEQPLPAVAERYEQTELRLLVALCAELQRIWGEDPFFLSCRKAAEVLNVKNAKGLPDHVKTWRWLFLLTEEGILNEVEKGDLRKRRASRYRYLAE